MKKALYLLSEFSDRDFDWLLTAGRRKTVSAKDILIRQGEPIDALYVLLAGTLAVQIGPDHREIAQLSAGEIVGEMSFIDARPPSATVRALENASIWVIPRTTLSSKLLQDVEFASHFYHSMAVFLSDRLRSTVSQMGYNEADARTEADSEQDINPQVKDKLDLAKARLNWLLVQLHGN